MKDGRLWTALMVLVVAVGASVGGRASGAEEHPGRVRCNSFAQEPGALIDTRDGASPLGQWVLGEEDAGWRVDDVDVDVVVKASGAVVAWATVCLVPVH